MAAGRDPGCRFDVDLCQTEPIIRSPGSPVRSRHRSPANAAHFPQDFYRQAVDESWGLDLLFNHGMRDL